MKRSQANALVQELFTQPFDKQRFTVFIGNVLNRLDEAKAGSWAGSYVKAAYRDHVSHYERLGSYTTPEKETVDALIVHLTKASKLERARTAMRDFVADFLETRGDKDAALVAFVSPSETTWRFSYVRMEYATVTTDSGKVAAEKRLTPARRFSYIVGAGEACHTAQARFLGLLEDTTNDPTLDDLQDAFSVEAVTKEFFTQYAALFERIHAALDGLVQRDKKIAHEFTTHNIQTVDFAKKLLGQIVFLYFLQKKGWLGVPRDGAWGSGPSNFLRRLADGDYGRFDNLYNDALEPLFYDTLATDRGADAWSARLNCRMPFLNGGLFEPLGGHDWRATDIVLPNDLFFNDQVVEEGVTGTGVLDVFDRYNFTVNEAEPLEKDVAIDPEMLGKVFENLIEENRRKGLGAYYTPREIVHYMCQESLINYLDTAVNVRHGAPAQAKPQATELFGQRRTTEPAEAAAPYRELVPRADIETLVRSGEQISRYDAAQLKTPYPITMPAGVKGHARLLDDSLAEITVCDPAVGSGAFPVGMMTEIVRARVALTPYLPADPERTVYHFKRHAIQSCLYGVDIDAGAVEIAKLRLWLSLVVDEEDVTHIKPLPNLDYKIVAGNSLLGFPYKTVRLVDVERLKQQLFDETDAARKAALKAQVDRLLADCFAASKRTFGYEVSFDFEIVFSEVFARCGGFDVVIANPPYGFRNVLSPVEKAYFRKQRGLSFPSGDVAELFIVVALRDLVRQRGTLTFIIPKKSLYGESWRNVREVWLANSLSFLMDASQAFEHVLLEQVAFSLNKCRSSAQQRITVGALNSEAARVDVFGPFPLGDIFVQASHNAQIYRGLYPKLLLDKINAHALDVNASALHAEIGISNITHDLTFEPAGNHPCVKGIDIVRWGLKPKLRYVDGAVARRWAGTYPRSKLIAQEIVAHVQNPTPHILVAMFLDDEGRLLNDTCVHIDIRDRRLDPRFVMAFFHSTFANWYAYNFVYNRAIRTMHFIDYYVSQIPLPQIAVAEPAVQLPIVSLVDQIIVTTRNDPTWNTAPLEREIDQLVYKFYDLTPDEIAIIEAATGEK